MLNNLRSYLQSRPSVSQAELSWHFRLAETVTRQDVVALALQRTRSTDARILR